MHLMLRFALACSVVAASLQCVPHACAQGSLSTQALSTAPTFQGTARVTGIADGDTVYADINGQAVRLRLAQIDAPEKSQAYGRRSEQSLRELVAKRDVEVSWRARDRYGRPISQITAGGIDVNAEQVRRGFAWVYREHSHDAALIRFEQQARASRIGLWADASPVAPWDWRTEHRKP